MQDVHLVHVSYPLAYLPDEQDGVELRQAAVVVDDAVEELASVHAAGEGAIPQSAPLTGTCSLRLSAADLPTGCICSCVSLPSR